MKKHHDQIRSTSIKNAPAGASSSRGKDAVEVNSQYDVFDSVFLSFRAYPPMVVTIRTPRVHSKALRRSPADSHVINESHQLRRGALELGNSLVDAQDAGR